MKVKNISILLVVAAIIWLLVEAYYVRALFEVSIFDSNRAIIQVLVIIIEFTMPVAMLLFGITLMDQRAMQELMHNDDEQAD